MEHQRDRELVAAQARDYRLGPELVGQRAGDALEQAIASLIAVLVVDRLEAIDLERDDGEAVTMRRRLGRHFRRAIGETLAIVESRCRVSAGKYRRPLLLLGAHLRLVLQVDIAAPAEQDQRHVQRQRGACNPNLRTETAGNPQMLEEGAAVPDQQHHGRDEHDQDDDIALSAFKTRTRLCLYNGYIHAGHERGNTSENA